MRYLSILLVLLSATSAYAGMEFFAPKRIQLHLAGRYAELRAFAEQEDAENPSAPSYQLSYLCIAYAELKVYDKLFPCLDRLEANILKGDNWDTKVVGQPQLQRAQAFIELRNYPQAIIEGKQALTITSLEKNADKFNSMAGRNFAEWHHLTATILLGLAHVLSGKIEEARSYAEQAANASIPEWATDDKVTGIAKIYLAIGDYQKAFQSLHGASENWFVKAFVLNYDRSYQNLPKKYMATKIQLEIGKIKEAKTGYDELFSIPQLRDNGEIYWLVLYDRGRIAEMEGDLVAAVDYWKKAAEVIEQQRSTINTEASKIGFVGDKQAVYKKLIAGLFIQNRYAEAFEYLERSKSRALVDMLASKKDFSVATGNQEHIIALLTSADKAESVARVQDYVKDSQRNLERSPVKILAEQAPELSSLVSVTGISITELQALIPADEALIEYYYDDKNLMAFVLTKESLQGVSLIGKGLEASIRDLRKSIEAKNTQAYLQPAQALYKELIAPLSPMLGQKKLIIVAHGALHYLPFATLHDGKQFLIEKNSFRLLPSASVLKYLRTTKTAKPAGVLAFGNPDLGNPEYDLRFAQDEALAVAKMMPQSKALLRKEATISAFQRFAPGFNYVHFATHGEFNSEAPLESSLLLSKEGDGDGRLTVGKLYSIRLDAGLVTLSACETGLGKVASGDDVVGLTRGFLYAGASTIVASLWKVDDQATAVLMNQFYSGLKTNDKREALRKAQIATSKKFPHPYYWAAFQLTGNAI